MPVAARVVRGTLIAASVTLLEVTTESFGAAALHRLDDLKMRNRQPMGAAIGLAMGVKVNFPGLTFGDLLRMESHRGWFEEDSEVGSMRASVSPLQHSYP